MRIIHGSSPHGTRELLHLEDHSSAIAPVCVKNTPEDPFKEVLVSHKGYKDNEDWMFCLKVINDDGKGEGGGHSYKTLHVEFEMTMLDIEKGFEKCLLDLSVQRALQRLCGHLDACCGKTSFMLV